MTANKQDIKPPYERVEVTDFVKRKIKLAKDGDVESAKDLLKTFCTSVKNNRHIDKTGAKELRNPHTQFHEDLLDYLAESFEKILNGIKDKQPDVSFALNLSVKGRRGPKQKKGTRETHNSWGLAVYEAFHEIRKNPAAYPPSPAPLDQAIKKIADYEHKGIETIREAYNEFRNLLNQVPSGSN